MIEMKIWGAEGLRMKCIKVMVELINKNIKRIGYTAIGISLIGIFIVANSVGDEFVYQDSMLADGIKAGKRKAILVLANGEKIELSKTDTLVYSGASTVIISVDSLGVRHESIVENAQFEKQEKSEVKEKLKH